MPYTYELWRLVEVKDDTRSTWELLARFPNAKRARMRIHEAAGSSIVSAEDNLYWYEDLDGTHTFRIEAKPVSATGETS